MTDQSRLKLTDVELADVVARLDDPKCHVCGGCGRMTAQFIRGQVDCSTCEGTGFFALSLDVTRSLLAELTDARAILGAELPHNWCEPLARGRRVHYAPNGTYSPDEAIALGAALIRAGLAAMQAKVQGAARRERRSPRRAGGMAMSERLSEADLSSLRRLFVRDMLDADAVEGRAQDILSLIAEVRDLRALMATPMPPKYEGAAEAYDAPQFYGGHIEARWLTHDLHVDDAIALGAALVRAGRQAKGGSE